MFKAQVQADLILELEVERLRQLELLPKKFKTSKLFAPKSLKSLRQ